MAVDLFANPQLLSLLEAARQAPEQDGPRLVLADWLDDQGEAAHAEFIRLQCRLAPGGPLLSIDGRTTFQTRCRRLLRRHGGAWAASLWRWPLPLSWHRGLISVAALRRFDASVLADGLPWIDTLRFCVSGWRKLQEAIDVAAQSAVNHLSFDLRAALGEDGLLDALARLGEKPSLRTLTIDWPLRRLHHVRSSEAGGPSCSPAASESFLRRLLVDCPAGKNLTHLASCRPFREEQAEIIHCLGVEPFHAEQSLWMHTLPPASFRLRRGRPAQK